MHFDWRYFLGIFIFFININGILTKHVIQVSSDNIHQVQKNMPTLLLYMTTKDCVRCGILYPKFMAAAQSFPKSTEIVFGVVKEKKLQKKLQVKKYPSIVYFTFGSKQHDYYYGDITVDTLFKLISSGMGGDFSAVARHYTVEVTKDTFHSIVAQPHQCKMLLVHTEKNEDSVDFFADMAEIFRNDDKIVFLRFDAKIEKELAKEFAENYPAMYWYGEEENAEMKIYGGRYEKLEFVSFVGDQTGAERELDGELAKDAGFVRDMNELIEDYSDIIKDAKDLKEVIAEAEEMTESYTPVEKKKAEYYLYLLKEIQKGESTTSLTDELFAIDRALDMTQGPKGTDLLNRKKNVVKKIINIVGHPLASKHSPVVKKREQRPIELHQEHEINLDAKRKKKGKKKKKETHGHHHEL